MEPLRHAIEPDVREGKRVFRQGLGGETELSGGRKRLLGLLPLNRAFAGRALA